MRSLKSFRMSFAALALTLAPALIAVAVSADTLRQTEPDFGAIDAYLSAQRKDLGIPGLAVAIVAGDQVVHARGLGIADASGRPVTPQTPFYIASVSKPITALAVMQLVEVGKIDLEAPVQQYLPWFELADKQASTQITVRNLLNHTSGITRMDGVQRWTRQGLDVLKAGLKTVKIGQPVGTTYLYSSLNYRVAGLLVEQASGQPYAEYVAEHIFKPLEMRHTHSSRESAMADGLADGHHYMLGRAFVARREGAFDLASGGLIASVEDLAHLVIANLNEGRYGDASVLSAQGIAAMHTPPVLSNEGVERYAMGWDVGDVEGTHFVGHSGLLYNFRSAIVMLPSSKRGVLLLANASGFEQLFDLDQVAKGVVALLEGRTVAPVSTPWRLPFLYWSVMLVPLLEIFGIVYGLRRWRSAGLGHILLTAVLYGGIAATWLTFVPKVMATPLYPGLRDAYPDLYYPLVTGVVLGIGWSVLFAAIVLARNARDATQATTER